MRFKSLTEYFSNAIQKFPNKPAVVTDMDCITYQELHELSNYFAQCILNQGVCAQEIIPIMFERSIDMITAILAILKSGCAFLPINPMTPCERQLFILKDSKAGILLTNDSSLIKVSHENLKIIDLSNKKRSSIEILNPAPANNLAYVMYTSGSTGNPKGVLIEHASMMNLFTSLIEQLNLTESEIILALTDYTFDISLIELLLPLMIGATIILTEKGTVADGLKIKKYLTQYNVSLMQATPMSWEILLKQKWRNNGCLKILVGGEKFSTRLAEALDYQKANVFNMYGPTETSMWSLYYPLGKKLSSHSVPLGGPLANTTVYLLDENLLPVPCGQEGQIYIGGRGLARGYLNNPTLTQEKFMINPKTGERLYRTGDMAILDKDGLIYFIGRLDDQFKLNGIRIEAGEIEKIIEQETFVKKAVVKLHEQESYCKILSVYIEIDEEKTFSLFMPIIEDSSIQLLKNIYNSLYCHAKDFENEFVNTCGWKNTFTGQEFVPEELKESYQFIESIILKSDLNSVLEIGAGTGSILKKFINKAKKYTVVEISERSINYIKSKLNAAQLRKISFQNKSIAQMNEEKQYSCVIVNSVIQYLPSIYYLITALKEIIKATLDGGTVIIGDVRSLELLEVFLLKKNKKPIYFKSRESEILLSPNFFMALKDEIPEISYVDISVKHGNYENELNYFRYDVILHIKKPIFFETPAIIAYDQFFDPAAWQTLMDINSENPLILKNIPNLAIIKMLESLEKQHPLLIKKNMPEYQQISFFDKDIVNVNFILKNYFEKYEKFVHYDSENPIEKMEIHFYPKSEKIIRVSVNKLEYSYHHYCREPFNLWLQELCFNKIKNSISRHLISWMRPSRYIWIEKWPLTANGKIDKKPLDLPRLSEKEFNDDNSILSFLQKTWESTTGSYSPVNRDFKEHGVSSLYIYFFLSKINEMYELDLGYRELEQYNTLFQLAKFIEDYKKETV